MLTPEFVLALAETASWNEAIALRAMVCRHIIREPSIQVHIPVSDNTIPYCYSLV